MFLRGLEVGEYSVIEISLQFNYEALKIRLILTKREFYILKIYRAGKRLSRFTLRFFNVLLVFIGHVFSSYFSVYLAF